MMLSKEQIEKINEYYEITLKDSTLSITVKKTGREKFLNIQAKGVNFGFDAVKGVINKEEKEKLEAEGKIICLDMKTFLKDYFNLSDEEILLKTKKQDKRTYEALKDEKERIHLLYEKQGEDFLNVTDITHDYLNFSYAAINTHGGKLADDENLYVVQYSVRCAIDDYYIQSFVFSQKPSQEEFEIARDITSFEEALIWNKIKIMYNPLDEESAMPYREIPREKNAIHWLDNEGRTIQEKIQCAFRNQRGN